jgi:diacylglycerol kinase family enzyme
MDKTYILYNKYAGNGKAEQEAKRLAFSREGAEVVDMTSLKGYECFFEGTDASDDIILCGGDGTLNRFVNDTRDLHYENTLYYFPRGSGNDFARELGKEKGADPIFPINKYVDDLPTVRVRIKGMDAEMERVFINGVGYGIDGYCCEVGDALKEKNEREGKDDAVNYTSIAIKGLLFDYKPTNATVVVDGKKYSYNKVWIAPTMNGRYYGGGMIPAPDQERFGKDGTKKLSLMVFHDSSKLKTLMVFPSIFKGEHVKNKKYVTVHEGKSISVEFDEPRTLQIDGETVLGVKGYTAAVNEGAKVSRKNKKFADAKA